MKFGTFALFALGFCAVTTTATAQQLRFATTAPGGVAATGNTLGLSKDTGLNGPGIRDSIGTFLTFAGGQDDFPLNAANPWPQGTTNDWKENGSAAVLSLPSETTVLYAELLWGGSFQYGTEDVTTFLDTPVTLERAGVTLGPDDEEEDADADATEDAAAPVEDGTLSVFRDFINTLDLDDFDRKKGN